MSAFQDRIDAGRRLARALAHYAGRRDVTVLGLPRGGVPVAAEVARALRADLADAEARKLGVAGQGELAMGALASGGVRVLNESVVDALHIDSASLERVAAQERRELERREQAYRGDRPPLDVRGRGAILVDDGLATGATMRAAVAAMKRLGPARVVVAVPVGASESVELLRREADEVVCPEIPEPFYGVGQWYDDFAQTSDEEVRALLAPGARPG